MRLSFTGSGALGTQTILLATATALTFVGLAVSAAWDLPWAWVGLMGVALALDVRVERGSAVLGRVLLASGLDPSVRGLIHLLTFGLLVAVHFAWATPAYGAVAVLLLLLPAGRSAVLVTQLAWRNRMKRPLETRNIDLGSLAGSTPWAASPDLGEVQLVWLGSVVLVLSGLGVAFDVIWPFVALTLVYAVALGVAAGTLAGPLLGRGGQLANPAWEERALEKVRALESEVVLYFSGTPDAIYQANMWLKPLADLGRPTLVLLRERDLLSALAPTNLPVVCMPDAVTVMNAKLTTVRVAFYAAHTGKNIHFLREPGPSHVFIGHGDSDKVSSINPFAKAYDELWVAGPAARDRWADADVGVHDSSVREVGRPQLVSIESDHLTPSARRTVLYAPTWEGWTDEDFGSSITDMGPALVERILAADPPWRVIYKPHPFTGLRDPRAKQGHQKVVRLLSDATATDAVIPRSPELAALHDRMAEPSVGAGEFDELEHRWSSTYWELPSAQGHLVVDDSLPTLFDCFNHADVLIADVSSVISDFLASGKPYVCANPRGIDPAVFRKENPSAGAAYLLDPACDELPEILRAVRGDDPTSVARLELREHLLGPVEPTPIVRWRSEVDRLVAPAEGKENPTPWVVGDPLDDPNDISTNPSWRGS